jgi:TRAP-type C4-dicarboxylate transport system permease small subunit
MIWLYLLIGLFAAISITLTHLSEAQNIRFWLSTAAVVIVWPAVVWMAYRQMWREAEGLADE